jgi:hypothetical protein
MSLDYMLREASHVKNQVVILLNAYHKVLQALETTLHNTPTGETSQAIEYFDDVFEEEFAGNEESRETEVENICRTVCTAHELLVQDIYYHTSSGSVQHVARFDNRRLAVPRENRPQPRPGKVSFLPLESKGPRRISQREVWELPLLRSGTLTNSSFKLSLSRSDYVSI